MISVWLDDLRPIPEGYDIWVLNYQDAIDCIEKYGDEIELISLDHDLADIHYGCQTEDDFEKVTEKTGYDVLLHIIQMKFDNKPIPKQFRVHSANPVGRDRMLGVIERYLK